MSGISAKAKALAILPKCTGFLSLTGSVFVIYDILKCGNNTVANGYTLKRNSIFHRIMLGLSTFDCIASFVLLILMATFFPLQGFWNALIYFRPRYQESQKANRRSSFFSETGKNSAHYSNNWEQDKSGSHEGGTGDLDMEYGGSDEMGGQQENLREEPPESVP